MKPHIHTAHSFWKSLVMPNDIVIDATSGNGHDTLFLSKLLKEGKLFVFDIQSSALEKTKEKLTLEKPTCEVTYILGSHAHFPPELLPHSVKLVVYNLGYLPGGNKEISTQKETTLISIKNALHLLQSGGSLSIMLYPGHPEGERESIAVLDFSTTLPKSQFKIEHMQWGENPRSPSLLLISLI